MYVTVASAKLVKTRVCQVHPQDVVDDGTSGGKEEKGRYISPTQHWNTGDLIQPSFLYNGGKWGSKQ